MVRILSCWSQVPPLAPTFDALLAALESGLQAALGTAVQGLVATARTRLEGAVAEVAKERAKGLIEVA
jgi:hypothetical protein